MVKRLVRRTRGLALPLVLAGCAQSENSVLTGEVLDSVGVRIVTYDLGAVDVPPVARVGDHDLEIGLLDGPGEYAFSGVVDLVVLDGGGLLISDRATPELRLFDGAGRYVRSLGQRGEGPGEFVSPPTVAGVSGDTVFAWDGRTGRVTVFRQDGQLVESRGLRAGEGSPVLVARRLSDGGFVTLSRWIPAGILRGPHDARLEVDSTVMERLGPEGDVLDTLRVMPDRHWTRMVLDGGGGRVRLIQALQPHSPRAFLASNGDQVVLARNDTFRFDLLTAAGVRASVRVRGIDAPADADQIRDHEEQAYREETGNETLDPQTRILFDFLPERLPAFAELLVARAGDVWVARPALDDSQGYSWLVFTPDGALQGSVRTPPRMRLVAIESSHVVGVVTDDFDVPYVRRYPLIPSAGPG